MRREDKKREVIGNRREPYKIMEIEIGPIEKEGLNILSSMGLNLQPKLKENQREAYTGCSGKIVFSYN